VFSEKRLVFFSFGKVHPAESKKTYKVFKDLIGFNPKVFSDRRLVFFRFVFWAPFPAVATRPAGGGLRQAAPSGAHF
jgi:hypothetical protein